MRYFTDEYDSLCIRHMDVRRIADREYSGRDIATLKKRKLSRTIRQAEEGYNTPPTKIDVYKYTKGPDGLKAEDFFYEDPQTGELKTYSSLEEVDAMFEEKYRKECKEFEERPPFDHKNVIERFEMECAMRRDKNYARLPEWVYNSVDMRLIELGYLPASAYDRLKAEDRQRERRRREIERATRSDRQSRRVPKHLKDEWGFHDGAVLYLKGNDCGLEMLIHEDFPREGRTTPNIKIKFLGGKIIERDENLNFDFVDFTLADSTKCRSYCRWLNNELYKTDDGYEARMRFATPQGYAHLTIACRDIFLEYDAGDEGLI